MKSIKPGALTTLILTFAISNAVAAPAEETAGPESLGVTTQTFPTVPLSALLERINGSPRKTILVAEGVPAEVVTGDIGTTPVNYTVFLTILRNNGLTAVVSDQVVSIIPEAQIRSQALRTLSNLEQEIPADEWVSFTVRPQHVSAPMLVPLFRPLMPQAAHLAALPEQNALIIVDRFANVKRIVGIIRQLDQPSERKE